MSNAAATLPDAIEATHHLRLAIQLAHWNITGPNFIALHELLGEQYDEIGLGLDMLAERHRHLGHMVPANTLASEAPTVSGDWQTMVEAVVAGHDRLLALLHGLEEHCTREGDPGSADLAIERIRAHHEHAWKLRAHLNA